MTSGYCSHQVVRHTPFQHHDGTLESQWLCRDCGQLFVLAATGAVVANARPMLELQDPHQQFWDTIASGALPMLIQHAPNGGSAEVYKCVVQAADVATSLLRKRGIAARERIMKSELFQNQDTEASCG